jgi:hypothetical protein
MRWKTRFRRTSSPPGTASSSIGRFGRRERSCTLQVLSGLPRSTRTRVGSQLGATAAAARLRAAQTVATVSRGTNATPAPANARARRIPRRAAVVSVVRCPTDAAVPLRAATVHRDKAVVPLGPAHVLLARRRATAALAGVLSRVLARGRRTLLFPMESVGISLRPPCTRRTVAVTPFRFCEQPRTEGQARMACQGLRLAGFLRGGPRRRSPSAYTNVGRASARRASRGRVPEVQAPDGCVQGSETTLQPQVSPLLERYDSLLGTDTLCSDREWGHHPRLPIRRESEPPAAEWCHR